MYSSMIFVKQIFVIVHNASEMLQDMISVFVRKWKAHIHFMNMLLINN